jgi:quercetin dioxygenase-like cupin family protein
MVDAQRVAGEAQMSAADEVIQSVDVTMTTPEPGLRRQVMSYSPNLMLVRHKMEPGWLGAAHCHPQEQLLYVVSGAIQLTVGNVVHTLNAGDSFVVAGGVPHQASADRPSEVLDIFTPYRPDYALGE